MSRHRPFIVAVVDDDHAVLRSLESLLGSADYAVRLFSSGAELVGSDCLGEIGCLITDVDMPGMDGYELLRAVRRARPELPTILITAYPDALQRSPSASSTLRVFTKPFHGHELLTAVSQAAQRHGRS